MTIRLIGAAAVLAYSSGAAQAQENREPFAGFQVGPELGLFENHAAVTVTEYDSRGEIGMRTDQTFRSTGIGGGVFAGYDYAIRDRVRIGAEISGVVGGKSNDLEFQGGRLSLDHKFGIRLAVRAGYVVTPRVMVYGLTGYGGNRYGVRDNIPVENSGEYRWGSSFLVGGGAEYRIDRKIGVRLNFKHNDNQTNQLFVGIPFRF